MDRCTNMAFLQAYVPSEACAPATRSLRAHGPMTTLVLMHAAHAGCMHLPTCSTSNDAVVPCFLFRAAAGRTPAPATALRRPCISPEAAARRGWKPLTLRTGNHTLASNGAHGKRRSRKEHTTGGHHESSKCAGVLHHRKSGVSAIIASYGTGR